jgi:F0F1-type ATP synthase membrane subunit b/b'
MDNEESLNNGNILINSCLKDFNELLQKTINLKNKIENEIKKLDELYNKIIDNLNKSYKNKYEKLKK